MAILANYHQNKPTSLSFLAEECGGVRERLTELKEQVELEAIVDAIVEQNGLPGVLRVLFSLLCSLFFLRFPEPLGQLSAILVLRLRVLVFICEGPLDQLLVKWLSTLGPAHTCIYHLVG